MNAGQKSGVVCRNINSFDQWGVELGKALATDARGLIAAGRCASPTAAVCCHWKRPHDFEEAMLMLVRRWLIRTGLFRMACRADGDALDAC